MQAGPEDSPKTNASPKMREAGTAAILPPFSYSEVTRGGTWSNKYDLLSEVQFIAIGRSCLVGPASPSANGRKIVAHRFKAHAYGPGGE
jgi:hypothetical protein